MAAIHAYDLDHVLLDSFKPMSSPAMAPKCLLAFLSAINKYGNRIHPWQWREKRLFVFLSTITKIWINLTNGAKEHQHDSSYRLQTISTSARIYRCSISPGSIQNIVIYIFPKEGTV